MKTIFFLDTASINDILFWKNYGLVDGITTNPKLLSLEKNKALIQLKKICEIVDGPVSAEVTEKKAEHMINQAKVLKKINKKIVIKLPCTLEGATAAKTVIKMGCKTNITLSFDPNQYLLFKDLNITYFSFIVGRVEDFGKSNIENLYTISKLIKTNNPRTKLISASIRNSSHLSHSIAAGSEVITVPPKTWSNIFNNEYTISGEDDFIKSWNTLTSQDRKGYEIKK